MVSVWSVWDLGIGHYYRGTGDTSQIIVTELTDRSGQPIGQVNKRTNYDISEKYWTFIVSLIRPLYLSFSLCVWMGRWVGGWCGGKAFND